MATKTLLFKYDKYITDEKNYVNDILPSVQSVANELTALNVPVTIDSIQALSIMAIRHSPLAGIKDYIVDAIVNAANSPQIGNLPISKEKLKSIIEVPDCISLLTSLQVLTDKRAGYNNTMSYKSYFTINAGTVSKITGIESIIEERHSYYSENSSQIDFFNKANDFATACNTLIAYMKGRSMNTDSFNKLKDLGMIVFNDGVCTPSYQFITNNIR